MQIPYKSLVVIAQQDSKTVFYKEESETLVIESISNQNRQKEKAQLKEKLSLMLSLGVGFTLLVGIFSRENIEISGWMPLLIGDVLMILIAVSLYRIVVPKTVDVVNFEVDASSYRAVIKQAKKVIRIIYLIFYALVAYWLFRTVEYIMTPSFLAYFSAVAMFFPIPMMLHFKLGRRRRLVNNLLKQAETQSDREL